MSINNTPGLSNSVFLNILSDLNPYFLIRIFIDNAENYFDLCFVNMIISCFYLLYIITYLQKQEIKNRLHIFKTESFLFVPDVQRLSRLKIFSDRLK